MMDWMYVIDRPFYPTVELFETEEGACAAMERDLEREKGTRYEVMAYVARVVTRENFKTDH